MGGVKKYLKREFKAGMFFLDHDSTHDFYLACWQRSRTVLPLLFIRTIIFVGCAGTMIASMILTTRQFNAGTWFIFLTHWGVLFNVIASGFALAVSVRALARESIEERLGLPWHIKMYWIFYNIATPIAFFITLFYWSLLTNENDEYAIDLVLDIFIHGVNSILMLALVLVSRHPTHLLHFYWSIAVGLLYMFFTLIFHFSDARSPFDTSWIYPMMDWDEPGITVAVVFGSAVGLIIMHTIVVLITLVREKLTRRFRETNSITISNSPISYS